MSPLFSIIIPVYNVEEFLRKCLDSVLSQGLEEYGYEVLLVNDGSKDGSVGICEDYCKKHSNFRLISQDNAGVSAARNHGIDEAQGKYIVFLDADDYLLDNGLAMAYKPFAGRDDLDVIHYFSSYDFWEKKPIDNSVNYDGTGHGYIAMGDLPSFCWLCFYKKEFLDRHHLRFKNYIVGEDQLFASSVYLANPRLASTRANIYRYVVRESSATTKRSVEHTRRCVLDYLEAYHDILQCMERYQVREEPEVYDMCIKRLNSKKMFGVSRIMSAQYNRKEFKDIKNLCTNYSFYPVLPSANGWKHRIQVAVMNGVMRHHAVYLPVSWAFNHIVVPYVLPKLRVNL